MASHNPVKFGGHRFCTSGDVTFLTCHIIAYGAFLPEDLALLRLVAIYLVKDEITFSKFSSDPTLVT